MCLFSFTLRYVNAEVVDLEVGNAAVDTVMVAARDGATTAIPCGTFVNVSAGLLLCLTPLALSSRWVRRWSQGIRVITVEPSRCNPPPFDKPPFTQQSVCDVC